MIKWLGVPVLCLLAAAAASPPGPNARQGIETPSPASGMFGRAADPIWDRIAVGDHVTMSAPANRRSGLRARWVEAHLEGVPEPVLLDLSGAIGRHRLRLVPGIGMELLWAPGGDALMVTTSTGGRNGVYDLILVDRVGGRTRERNISTAIRRRYSHPARCDYPEPPNVAGIAWLPNGNILVAAEICTTASATASVRSEPTK